MIDPLEKLTPFEKTVLLEIARCQAQASAAFQAAYAVSGQKLPDPKKILTEALSDSIAGIRETLKQNGG